MNNPRISVVMAAYNSKRYIREAIESILNQTFKDFEFIIVNDASTDKTLEIIKEYKKKDERIKLVNNKKNLGRAISRNKALKLARGKYIAILDSDDVSLPNRLEIQYEYLEQHSPIFLIGGSAINVDLNGKNQGYFKAITSELRLIRELKKRNAISHPTVMFRNEKDNLYREKFSYSQDYDFYLILLSKGKRVLNLPDKLIKYRFNPKGVSFSKRVKQVLFAQKAQEFYFQRLKYEKDEYDKFDPGEILNINIDKSTNKLVLKFEVETNFKLNNFQKTRRFCKKYFKYYGPLNKILIYYLSSFIGKRAIEGIRKIRI